MAKPTINPNQLGDLVPKCAHEDDWPSLDMGPKYQEQLKEITHKTTAVRNRWKCGLLPTWHDSATEISEDLSAFRAPAFNCAVHLSGGNVGVLRMHSWTKSCALFLRLKRTDWFAWADKNKVPRSAGRVFTKRMDRELGKKVLMDARAFKLGDSSVHHPSVLALLCTMSRHSWLHMATHLTEPQGVSSIDEVDAFTLVALPPLPAEFEQCLGLLGHSAAFVKDNAGSDDDEVSLSTRRDAKPIDEAWGPNCPGDQVIGSLAHLFEEGATSIRQLAQPDLFVHGLSKFDCYSRDHARVLERMQRASDAAAPAARPKPSADAMAYLDPSDDEGAVAAAPAPAPALAPAAPKTKAKTPAPQRQRPPQATLRAPPKKKKKNASDSDELSDSGDGSESLSETSEEEEETSSSDDSGDEDDEEDDDKGSKRPAMRGSSSGSELSEFESPAATPPPKKRPRPTADATTTPTPPSRPLTVADANGDQALRSVLSEMAKPFCERVERLCNGRGIAMFSEHNRLKADMHLLQEARTPVAFCAAMISIGNTLSDLQAERFSKSCHILVDREAAHRLRGLAAQTSQFADAVHSALSGPGGLGSAVEE
jgi:hypothetical protein